MWVKDELSQMLKESLLYSFRGELKEYNNFMHLCEELGVPDVTNKMAEKIAEYCYDYVNKGNTPDNKMLSGKVLTYNIKIPENLCRDIMSVFVYSLNVEITLNICTDKKIYYTLFKDQNSGSYDNLKHKDSLIKYNGHNNLVFDNISFGVTCFAESILAITTSVYYAVIHELNHAYEDYQRLLKGKETYQQWLNKTGYLENNNNLRSVKTYEQSLGFIFYVLSPTEINANIAQIYGELKGKHYGFTFSASEAIRNTVAYKRLNKAYDELKELETITDEHIKERVLNNYNNITHKQIDNYNEILSNLKDDLDYTTKYIFNKTAKFIPKINAEYEANKYKDY